MSQQKQDRKGLHCTLPPTFSESYPRVYKSHLNLSKSRLSEDDCEKLVASRCHQVVHGTDLLVASHLLSSTLARSNFLLEHSIGMQWLPSSVPDIFSYRTRQQIIYLLKTTGEPLSEEKGNDQNNHQSNSIRQSHKFIHKFFPPQALSMIQELLV